MFRSLGLWILRQLDVFSSPRKIKRDRLATKKVGIAHLKNYSFSEPGKNFSGNTWNMAKFTGNLFLFLTRGTVYIALRIGRGIARLFP